MPPGVVAHHMQMSSQLALRVAVVCAAIVFAVLASVNLSTVDTVIMTVQGFLQATMATLALLGGPQRARARAWCGVGTWAMNILIPLRNVLHIQPHSVWTELAKTHVGAILGLFSGLLDQVSPGCWTRCVCMRRLSG